MLRAKASYLRGRCISTLSRVKKNATFVDIHPEVEDALEHSRPVVALETTIVTHGMPSPTNLETAMSVERIVRSTGSVPATIGIIKGRVKIGLTQAELHYLADIESNKSIVKISRRDIGPAIAAQRDGGTTCSATLIFAALAGIKVFSTGGLGGVHRCGEKSMDVSADLHELTRCPVGLVSAGVKSILDIGRTLEYLETLGVPVLTYGSTSDFPAFYSAKSGFKSPWTVNDPDTAARVLHAHQTLNMSNGALFGAPIPSQYEAVGQELQSAVEQAVTESEENGMNRRGKEVTPWLLARVAELTRGKSLASNVALIENTALIGGRIAASYCKILEEASSQTASAHPHHTIPQSLVTLSTNHEARTPSRAKLAVVGSAAVDITALPETTGDGSRGGHSTTPGTVNISLGGVGRNVAEAAHRIQTSRGEPSSVALIAGIGEDSFGRLLVDETTRLGMRTDGLVTSTTHRSAVCNMILDDAGNLLTGVADMGIAESLAGDEVLKRLAAFSPSLVALDGNLCTETITSTMQFCQAQGISGELPCEPTSMHKSIRILPAISASARKTGPRLAIVATPNVLELKQLYLEAKQGPGELMEQGDWWKTIHNFRIGAEFRMDLEHLARRHASDDDPVKGSLAFLVAEGVGQMAVNLLPFFDSLVIKCGAKGVVIASRYSGGNTAWAAERSNPRGRYVVAQGVDSEVVVIKHCPAIAVPAASIVNVTGCGDSLVGSLAADLAANPRAFDDPDTLEAVISRAQTAAILTLKSPLAVSPELSTMGVS